MRLAIVAAAAVLAFTSAASAQTALTTWTAPSGAFSIQRPAAWPVDDMTRGGGAKEFVAGTADDECWITVIDRPETASASGLRVKESFAKPIAPDIWASVARSQRIFDGAAPVLETSGVDELKPFPVQTATFAHPSKGKIIAAIHARPGLEAYAFCVGYTKADRTALFTEVAESFATPKDAEWLTPPVVAPAPEAAPPPEDPKKKRR